VTSIMMSRTHKADALFSKR